jgi:hypothetical protein
MASAVVAKFNLVLKMAVAVIQYESSSGRTKSFKVRPRQAIRIGASNSADIKLSNVDGVAPQHCEVKFEGGRCAIRNLTKGKRSVRVNGAKVSSSSLENGDCIEIGQNRLTIVLEQSQSDDDSKSASVVPVVGGAAAVAMASSSATNPVVDKTSEESKSAIAPSSATSSVESSSVGPSSESKTESRSEASPEDLLDEPESDQPIFERYSNGVASFELTDFKEWVHPEVLKRKDHWSYAVFYNHRASKLSGTMPEEVVNLLDDMPEEVSGENDLYFEMDDDEGPLLKRFDKYSVKNSGFLCLIKKGERSLNYESDLKFMATWFMNPDGLKFHLMNGTKFLASKIFGFFDTIVVRDLNKKKDLVLFNDLSVTDWDSFLQWIKEHTYDAGN